MITNTLQLITLTEEKKATYIWSDDKLSQGTNKGDVILKGMQHG